MLDHDSVAADSSTDPRRRLPTPGWLFVATLLVIVAPLGGWLGCRIHRQQSRLDHFEQLGADLTTEPASPEWLHDSVRRVFGDEFASGLTVTTQIALDEPLYGQVVTDADLRHLGHNDRLRVLFLDNSQVTDEGLRQLQNVPNLRELSLYSTGVTDTGVSRLSGLGNLESLDLTNTQITDAGLDSLRNLTALKELDLRFTMVTDKGADKLQAELPGVRILR